MRHILGWSVVMIVSLVTLIAVIAFLVAIDAPTQGVGTGASGAVIAGIAGGLRLKDKIVGVR